MPDARLARYLTSQSSYICVKPDGNGGFNHLGFGMPSNSEFARLIARPIDRIHIAASTTPTRDELYAIEGYEVSPGDAALAVGFLARDGMTWSELRVPLRYPPEDGLRARLHESVEAGVITIVDDFIAYTPAGAIAATAVLDAHAKALEAQWSGTSIAVETATRLLDPVATAADDAGKPSSGLINATLVSNQPTMASRLWRQVGKIRRYRADCHAEAWARAGHTVESIVALPIDDPERGPIEAQTDELNAALWQVLPEADRLPLMAALASLDGSGTPT